MTVEKEKHVATRREAQSALRSLQKFLDELPEGKESNSWTEARLVDQEKYGNRGVFSMFPDSIQRNTQFLMSFVNTLRRNGINTKEELIAIPLEDLVVLRNLGPKTLLLAGLLKDVLRTEQSLTNSL